MRGYFVWFEDVMTYSHRYIWPGRPLFLLLFSLLLSVTLPTGVRAEDWPPLTAEERSMTSFPEQPGAAAVVLLREEEFDDAHNHSMVYVRIKILAEPGRKYADVEIPYSRRNFIVYDISGRTVHSDGTVIPFTGKPFDKVVVRAKEHGTELRYQVKSFTLPDVQVGSVLEYRYYQRYDDHSFYAPEWDIQGDLFQKKASFKFIPFAGDLLLPHDRVGSGVAWTSHLPPGVKPTDHQLPRTYLATRRDAFGYVDLQMANIPPIVHEPYMPPVEALRYRVKFYYMVNEKQDEFWRDEGKFWRKDVENFLGRKNGVAEAVAQTVSASDPPELKARSIYGFVARLDNWSYDPARSEQEDHALGIKADRGAQDVLKQHGGEHDDLNRLLVAMLRSAGIPASLMWVPSRDQQFFEPTFLGTSQLVAEIVIAQINGKEVSLDPGSRFCPFGLLDWRYTNVLGVRESEAKGTEIAQSSLPDYNQAMIQRLGRLQMTADGKAEGTVKVGFYGLEAMSRRQLGGKTDAEGRKKLLEDEVKDWLPADSEVTLTNTPDWNATEGHLATEFKISCPLAVGAGKRWIVPAHLFQVNEKPRFSSSDRVNAVYFDYLTRELDEIHITLPPDLEVESLPPNEKVLLDFALYATTQKQESANTVLARRDLAMGGMSFPLPVYKELKGFFDKVKSGDDQPVVAKAAAHAELR
jgi:transglutaminase-like putative cysteine protease